MQKLLQYFLSFSVYVFHSLAITHRQYANRYPIFPDAPLSTPKFLLDTVGLILSVYLVFQIIKYKRSQNVEQDLSILAVAVVMVIGSWNLFVLLAGYGFWSEHKVVYKTFEGLPSGMGSFGLFWLDFVWFVQLEGKLFGLIKLVPQASLNFASFSSFGYCLSAAKLDTAASGLIVLSWVLSPSNDSTYPLNKQQIRDKLNYEPILSAFVNLVFGGLIIYQHKIYQNNKPIVKLRYIQTEECVELQNLRVC